MNGLTYLIFAACDQFIRSESDLDRLLELLLVDAAGCFLVADNTTCWGEDLERFVATLEREKALVVVEPPLDATTTRSSRSDDDIHQSWSSRFILIRQVLVIFRWMF